MLPSLVKHVHPTHPPITGSTRPHPTHPPIYQSRWISHIHIIPEGNSGHVFPCVFSYNCSLLFCIVRVCPRLIIRLYKSSPNIAPPQRPGTTRIGQCICQGRDCHLVESDSTRRDCDWSLYYWYNQESLLVESPILPIESPILLVEFPIIRNNL